MDLALTAFAALGGSVLGAVSAVIASFRWQREHPRPVPREQLDQVAEAVVCRMAAIQDQAWFWTPQWQEGERAVDEDLAAGRSTRVDSVAEMDDLLARANAGHVGTTA
ncbi:MAG TPA: hypothetical protein VFM55_14895 [Micromonosporaceae bacterium]|nr:hypothetical protein [Micromonosporaceae bacterium]